MKNHFDRSDLFWSSAFLRVLPAAVLWFCLALPGQAAGTQQLQGHLPPVIQRLNLPSTGPLPESTRLNLAISLPLRQKADLTNLLQQLYDPASPNYRKFLKPDQFAERFGPSQQDYDALQKFATDNGLTITGTQPNRTLLDLNLSVADIRRIFHVNILVYQHPKEPRTFYAPDAEPSIDSAIPIFHVSGLDNFILPRPALLQRTPLAGQLNKPGLGSGPAGEYFAYDFRDAYVPGVTLDGSGQTVALFELDGYFPSDILAYETQGRLPNIPLVNIPVDGFNGPPTPIGDPEVSLDIEMVVDMAPGLNQILVYEQENGAFPITDILNKIATDDLANQISSSWLIGDDPAYDPIYLQYAAQGQSFFQCAGDNGSYLWSDLAQQHADDPNVTIVGGTTLSTTGPNGAWLSETVWNWNVEFGGDGTLGAGGGGISTNYTIPYWQQGIDMSNNMGSTTFRNVPDVALTADNIYVVCEQGQSQSVGGTSAAAPLWAAFCALVNQKAQLTGNSPMGFINPALYRIGKGPLYSQAFHDITTGNNTNFDDPTQFFAVPGYDLCTGWGTPAGIALINALVPNSVPVPILQVLTNMISGGNGNGKIDPDECNNLTFVVTNQGTIAATHVQGTLSSTTPGVLFGQPTASFPDIPPGVYVQNLSPFTVSTQPGFICGTVVQLQLVLKCDQVVQTNLIRIPTGAVGAPVRFDNTTALTIPAGNFNGVFSPMPVTGIPTVGKVTVSVALTALEDEWMVLNLVSPNGTNVQLAANNGGLGQNFGIGCSPDSSRTTFDDAALQSISTGLAPFVGTYSPASPLSAFNLLSGANANGIWQLNVIDELSGNAATLQCWSLFISPEQCPDGGGECPGSDLSIAMTANPITTTVGDNLTYSLIVSNAGPSLAKNVLVIQNLPSSIQYISSLSSQGTISQAGSALTFSLGTLEAQSNATISVQTVPTLSGLFTSTASVGSTSSDPNPNNNNASASVLVTKPVADLAVTLSASPTSVPVNGQVTFTMTVTNNGPATALGVTLTNVLPPNANFVSATTTKGSVSPFGTLATIGSLAKGSGATVVLVLSPTVVGSTTFTTTAGLAPSQFDPVSGNNSASATITVIPAADLGVSVTAAPNPALSGSNVTYVVTVTNAGPSAATAVVMNQTVPQGATYHSTTQTNVTNINGVITWNIGNMPGGTSQILTNVLTATNLLSGVSSNVMVSTLTVFGQPGDPQTNNNTVVVSTTVLRPIVILIPAGAILTSESFQPSDGAVEPGETVGVKLLLQNVGNIPTTNLVATLQTNSGVTPVLGQGQANYGALTNGYPPAAGLFSFTANSTNGGTVVATLQLQDGPASLGAASFTFVMPVVSTFWQNQFISIPALQFTNIGSGPAGPYPSSNFVSGVNSYVANVSVTVSNFYHTFPSDAELLVVGPGGQSSILMSYAAQETTQPWPVTITFDQTASSVVPAAQQLFGQSYQPAEYNVPVFTNGPAGPFTANLSVFTGVPPNGWWRLYAYDISNGDVGAISNGWGLAFTTITPVNQIADLGVTVSASPNPVFVGSNVTYSVTVTNLSTNAASNVFLTNLLSAGLSFVSASTPPVSPIGQTNNTFSLGTLAGQSNLTLSIVAAATAPGSQTSALTVGSSLIDPNTNNNLAGVSVTAVLPIADLSAGISAVSGANALLAGGTVVIGSNVIYTLGVTNNGPNPAINVVGVLTQAATGSSSSVFTNSFGNINPGNMAVAMFTNAPHAAGSLTNTWTISSGSSDANSANNAVSLAFTVTLPEPVIAITGVRLLQESFSPPNGAIDSNETVTVAFTLANVGAVSTTNLIATLQTNVGVIPSTSVPNTQTYGVISPGTSEPQTFQFTGRGGPGATITAVLSLADNTYSLGFVSNSFAIPAATNFSNPAFISIPGVGPATPYPSGILVSVGTQLVTKVTAALQGFTHSFPQDVNVLLISPSGRQAVLMGHAGGAYSVTNLILTFDDAAQSLTSNQLVSGTDHPTQIGAFDLFPGISGTPNNTNLSIFSGASPNGVWSLYVYDDTPGNDGSIANGWTLGLTLANPVNPPGTLAVGMTHLPDSVLTSNFLTFTIVVTNLALSGATNVVLTDTLPPAATLVSASASQGTVNTSVFGTVTYYLGTLTNAGDTAWATNVVQPLQAGLLVNSAAAAANGASSWLGAAASNTVAVNSLALFNLAATNLNNSVKLTLSTFGGQVGQNYIIQVSTNLASWTNLSTNTAVGLGQFSITNSFTNGPARFYRALHLPQ